MERYAKIAGLAGATALIISALLGALFSVGFGAIMLRSLLWAVVFGVLGGGSAYLFDTTLLPEGEPSVADAESTGSADTAVSDDGTAAPAETVGENVNIVVEDEPVENQFAALAGSSGFEDDDGPQPVVPSMVEEVEESQVDDAGAAGIQEEESPAVATVTRAAPGGGNPSELPDIGGMAGAFAPPVDDDAEPVETAEPVDVAEVEELSDEVGTPAISTVTEVDTIPSVGGGSDDDAGGMAGNDPAALAKALQTMLKRD